MTSFSIYKAIYFTGIALIFIGGYRLFKQLPYGDAVFSCGILMYAGIQIALLFFQPLTDWNIFEYLKLTVNILLLISVFLLLVLNLKLWYYPFVVGLLLDFIANILRRIKKT